MKLKYRKTKMKYMVADIFEVLMPEIEAKLHSFEACCNAEISFGGLNRLDWSAGRIYDRDGRVSLTRGGILSILPGETWDGASGPTKDSKKSKRASLTHDMLYRLMRQGKIPISWRKAADDVFYRLLIEDGMWSIRAKIWYRAVRRFAADFVDRENIAEVFST